MSTKNTKKNGAAAAPVRVIRMELEKTTEGAVRYQELDDAGKPRKRDADGALIGQLYIRKAGFGGEFPRFLKVSLEG